MKIVSLTHLMTHPKANFSYAMLDDMLRRGVAELVWRSGRVYVLLP